MKAPQMTDDRFLAEGEAPYDGPIAILRTFVLQTKVKVLSGLAELSYVAGREGDDEWEWAAEAEDALIDAFFAKNPEAAWPGPRFKRYLAVREILAAAFRGGAAQRAIDLGVTGGDGSHRYSARQIRGATVSEPAIAVARAYAVIYLSEVEFPLDRDPENVRREIGYVATKVAQWHHVTDAEAAYCALKAFEERGLETSLEAAAWALDRAASGRAEREAREANALVRATKISAATAGLFGEVK
jgi:hypothetical protein